MGERLIFIDYAKAKECVNEETWYTCHKCGRCGRKFNQFGLMIDDGGTTIEEDDE